MPRGQAMPVNVAAIQFAASLWFRIVFLRLYIVKDDFCLYFQSIVGLYFFCKKYKNQLLEKWNGKYKDKDKIKP